jgi:hypothetical protein
MDVWDRIPKGFRATPNDEKSREHGAPVAQRCGHRNPANAL